MSLGPSLLRSFEVFLGGLYHVPMLRVCRLQSCLIPLLSISDFVSAPHGGLSVLQLTGNSIGFPPIKPDHTSQNRKIERWRSIDVDREESAIPVFCRAAGRAVVPCRD